VSVPNNAVLGTSYNVKFSVNSVPEGEGAVQFNIKYGVSFPVIVVEKTVVPGGIKGGIVWVVGIIIVVLVFILIYLGMRKNKGSESVSSKKSSKKK